MAQISDRVFVSFKFLAASETVSDGFRLYSLISIPVCSHCGGQSNSVILSFFLMMVVNPEAQKEAQAQIDAVVGANRLPMIKDRPLLPYIDAILRETLRYNTILPLCKCCLPASIPWLIYLSISDPTRCCGRRRLCRISHPEGSVTQIPKTFCILRRIRRSYRRIKSLVSFLHPSLQHNRC